MPLDTKIPLESYEVTYTQIFSIGETFHSRIL